MPILRANVAQSTSTQGSQLFVLRNANLQSIADQLFTRQGSFTSYVITDIIGKQKTGAASVACLGGIYPSANKGGSAIVSALQSWLSLDTGKIVVATLTAIATTDVRTETPYLSLSTGSTAAITADLFIFGYVVD